MYYKQISYIHVDPVRFQDPKARMSHSIRVTSGAELQSVQYVLFDIWTRCKACTHTKIKDHSWKPGHKLEFGRQK